LDSTIFVVLSILNMSYKNVEEEIDKQLYKWLQSTQSSPVNRSVEGFITQSGHSLELLSDSRIAAFIYNFSEGNYYFFNNYFAELLDVSRDYIKRVGIRIMQEKVHPDDFLKCLNITHQALKEFELMKDMERESTQFRLFFRLQKKSGEYSWVMQSNRQIKWDAQLPTLDLAYILELFDQVHAMKVMGVLQTSRRTIELFPSGEIDLLNMLTGREMEILRLIASGLSSKEISEKLMISSNTVKSHRRNILQKLNVKNMMQAINILDSLT
ncbi:MAG: LuxR C-terminal-related transcriptional regulator, partial [Bacteroidia bacterium]